MHGKLGRDRYCIYLRKLGEGDADWHVEVGSAQLPLEVSCHDYTADDICTSVASSHKLRTRGEECATRVDPKH